MLGGGVGFGTGEDCRVLDPPHGRHLVSGSRSFGEASAVYSSILQQLPRHAKSSVAVGHLATSSPSPACHHASMHCPWKPGQASAPATKASSHIPGPCPPPPRTCGSPGLGLPNRGLLFPAATLLVVDDANMNISGYVESSRGWI